MMCDFVSQHVHTSATLFFIVLGAHSTGAGTGPGTGGAGTGTGTGAGTGVTGSINTPGPGALGAARVLPRG